MGKPLTTLPEMLEPLVGERGASVPASVLAAALEAAEPNESLGVTLCGLLYKGSFEGFRV